MTLREISALISTVLVTAGTVWYVVLALREIKVKPVLASWVVIFGTMTLSFATYWTTPNHSLIANACNAISILSTGAILVVAIVLNRRYGKGLTFSSFQKKSLWASLVIALIWVALVWGFHGTGIVPNVMTQVLMLIGYGVTAEKLWYAKGNNESMFTWWCILVAAMVALYTGIVSKDKLVILYASRTTFGTVVLIYLMHRAEKRTGR